jgi:hypothetical protein
MFAGIPSATWDNRRDKAITYFVILPIAVASFAAVTAAVAFAILTYFRQTLLDSFGFALASLVIVFCLIVVFFWYRGRKTAGAVLVDCGANSLFMGLGLSGAILALLLISLFGLRLFIHSVDASDIGSALTYPFISVLMFIMAFGRLQIRENGIWMHHRLFKWELIESYRWEGDRDSVLAIQLRPNNRILFLRQGRMTIPFPREQKDTVDEILKSRIAAAT